MKWGKLLPVTRLVAAVVDAIVPGAVQVEHAAENVATLKGKAKQDAVIDLVKSSTKVAEAAAGRDLVNDPAVEAATRAVIDAVVNLHNVTAKVTKQPVPVSSSGD